MIQIRRYDDEARREDAAAWVVRLETGDLGETEALAFDHWLSASPLNGQAFDNALSVAQAYARSAESVNCELSLRRVRPQPMSRRSVAGLGALA
ncbi:MAG: DUF4880 domain-containing protein, partial [Phenylobacterium sp.]|nr:DUF4880 domain-containing protein [Phenylobacterium sp.]